LTWRAISGRPWIQVDGQAVVGGLGQGLGGGPALARDLHASLEASVVRNFPSNGLINCMCHSTENIFNFSGSALARVSDDFYPTNPASHTVGPGKCCSPRHRHAFPHFEPSCIQSNGIL